jgi:hypothetical protein
MKRRDVSRRIAARRRLHAIAHEAAAHAGTATIERALRERCPDLVMLVGDRELEAILAVSVGALGSA